MGFSVILRLFFFHFHIHVLLFMGNLMLSGGIPLAVAVWTLTGTEVVMVLLKHTCQITMLLPHLPNPPLLDVLELLIALGFGTAMVVDWALQTDVPWDLRPSYLFADPHYNVVCLVALLWIRVAREVRCLGRLHLHRGTPPPPPGSGGVHSSHKSTVPKEHGAPWSRCSCSGKGRVGSFYIAPLPSCDLPLGARLGGGGGRAGARGPHAHRNTARQATDGLWTEARGQHKQSNDPRNNQHNPQYANYWAPLTRKRHIPPHPAQPPSV